MLVSHFKLWRPAILQPVDPGKVILPLWKALSSKHWNLEWKLEYLGSERPQTKGEGPYLFWKSVIRVNHIPIYRGSQKGLFWLPRDSYTYLDGNQTPSAGKGAGPWSDFWHLFNSQIPFTQTVILKIRWKFLFLPCFYERIPNLRAPNTTNGVSRGLVTIQVCVGVPRKPK